MYASNWKKKALSAKKKKNKFIYVIGDKYTIHNL